MVVALRDALGVSERVLVQGASGRALSLDVASRIGLEPDLLYWAGSGACSSVTSGKRIMPAGYPNVDLHQLTAYTIATRLESGILAYAAGEAVDSVH